MFANTFYHNYRYSADDNILVLLDKQPISAKAKILVIIYLTGLNKPCNL